LRCAISYRSLTLYRCYYSHISLAYPPVTHHPQATSALDTITENSIQEALAALGKNRTVVVIAHRLSTVKNAQQIVVMDAGRVLECGSHEALLQDSDSMYSHMWNMQSASAKGSPLPLPLGGHGSSGAFFGSEKGGGGSEIVNSNAATETNPLHSTHQHQK
jgi:ABC-type multidrug transport system ATPase subunit